MYAFFGKNRYDFWVESMRTFFLSQVFLGSSAKCVDEYHYHSGLEEAMSSTVSYRGRPCPHI